MSFWSVMPWMNESLRGPQAIAVLQGVDPASVALG